MSGWAPWTWRAVAALAAGGWLYVLAGALRARRHLGGLGAAPVAPAGGRWPRLSVIAPSRDEAAGVEQATRSLLAQDYPELQVVAVDDRSGDATGAILDRLAASDARLRVVHVSELPSGWLGKNHASHVGAEAATGEWLLFTDGDVLFAPGALRRAVALAEERRLGHLVAIPRMLAPGFFERSFVATFVLFANLKFRIWDLRRPRTSAHIGLGAFNLVRRDDYRRAGGHRVLAMEVLDDVKLGLILRRSGARQAAVDSEGAVSVRWNAGFRATARGLLKNTFAAAEWRSGLTVIGAGFLSAISIAPWLALWWAPLDARWIAALTIVLAAGLHGGAARRTAGGSGLEGLAWPVAMGAFAFVLLWSAFLALVRGGIEWRGTRYSLDELRAGCVRERDWPVSKAVGWGEETDRLST